MMCGKRFSNHTHTPTNELPPEPIQSQDSPINIQQAMQHETRKVKIMKDNKAKTTEKTKYSSGKKGICVNCDRQQFIVDKEGFCSTCHKAVLLIDKSDSVAYQEALDNAKQNAHARNPKTTNITATAEPDSGELHLPKINSTPADDLIEAPKSILNLTIAEVASAGIPDIINRLAAEEDYHMLRSQKCRQARMILEQL